MWLGACRAWQPPTGQRSGAGVFAAGARRSERGRGANRPHARMIDGCVPANADTHSLNTS
jgi:hypothetical protein